MPRAVAPRLLAELVEGHRSAVLSVATVGLPSPPTTPTTTIVVSGSTDGAICLWDLSSLSGRIEALMSQATPPESIHPFAREPRHQNGVNTLLIKAVGPSPGINGSQFPCGHRHVVVFSGGDDQSIAGQLLCLSESQGSSLVVCGHGPLIRTDRADAAAIRSLAFPAPDSDLRPPAFIFSLSHRLSLFSIPTNLYQCQCGLSNVHGPYQQFQMVSSVLHDIDDPASLQVMTSSPSEVLLGIAGEGLQVIRLPIPPRID